MERICLISGAGLFFATLLIAGCPGNNPHEPPRSIFELRGNHSNLPCETCHGNDGFKRLPTECSSCHEEDRPDLDHFPETDCGECHNEFGWERLGEGYVTDTDTDIPFDHDVYLDLRGAHDLPCESCHVDAPDEYAGLDFNCESCHLLDDRPAEDHYIGVLDPPSAIDPTREHPPCASCHVVGDAWVAGRYHPVVLPHNAAGCNECHTDYLDRGNGNWTCLECHEDPLTAERHGEIEPPVAGYQHGNDQCIRCHEDATRYGPE